MGLNKVNPSKCAKCHMPLSKSPPKAGHKYLAREMASQKRISIHSNCVQLGRSDRPTVLMRCQEHQIMLPLFSLFYYHFYCIFHYHLFILYPLSPMPTPLPLEITNCCLSPWVLPLLFFFAQSLLPPKFPLRAVILLSICESVFILLISSVCSLDSTYEWNHMVIFFYPHPRTFFSLLLEREGEGETPVWERNTNLLPPEHTQTMDGTHLDWGLNLQPRHAPNSESNPQPFGYGTTLQPTEPRQPQLFSFFKLFQYYLTNYENLSFSGHSVKYILQSQLRRKNIQPGAI